MLYCIFQVLQRAFVLHIETKITKKQECTTAARKWQQNYQTTQIENTENVVVNRLSLFLICYICEMLFQNSRRP